MDNPFAQETFGKIAFERAGEGNPDFRLYEVGWLETGGHPSTWNVLECKGAIFRESARGPRKGQKCIMVKGSKRTVYVTKAEMEAYEKANTPEYRLESNDCNCHPETCVCNPFKIVDREGNKITTAFSKQQAEKVLEIMNK
jgi:hypothetical protein